MNNFDWQWWQFFIAIHEHGSLNQAAIALNISQPTLSRQLLAMEKHLGQSLFDRSTQGLKVTEFGQLLLEESLTLQASANRLQRLAEGQSQALNGRIRLAVNEMIAHYYLPIILPKFMDLYPNLSVEVDVSNKASSLDKRDADVAIRMFTPTQLDIVCRKLFDIPLGFYASSRYLEHYGTPTSPEQLFNYRVIGYDRDRQFEDGAQQLGWQIHNEQFKCRCDFMPLHLELAANHGGIIATHQALAELKKLKPINLGLNIQPLPVYLVCHRDVQHNQKIRVLMDFLAEHLPNVLNN